MGHTARGFSLIDVLVSMAVIALLLAILAPSLSLVQETTRRVVCASNIRQLGLGAAMYRNTYRDYYPDSRHGAKLGAGPGRPQAMMRLRDTSFRDWDGLGLLYAGQFIDAHGVYYCPSHHGHYPQRRYTEAWLSGEGRIVGNYHYRGDVSPYPIAAGPGAVAPVSPASTALIADGMATRLDFNHTVGANVLRADLSTAWFADTDGSVYRSLSETLVENGADAGIPRAWNALDGTPPQ